ncbi:DUF2971 domain-containing protein [Thorsellia kenyensis]|uniref:DUF2971 domain-containing protein n=1 Tax=Thorsellia kenyensis TaxID=1549888 RepID=A0ABV6C7U3_9GAMM
MRIFKYFHPDRIEVLESGKIRFTQPSDLNDPFELKPNVKEISSKENIVTLLMEAISEEKIIEYYMKSGLSGICDFSIFRKNFIENYTSNLPTAINVIDLLAPKLKETLHFLFNKAIGILCLTQSNENLLMWAHYTNNHQGYVMEFEPNHPFFNQKKSGIDELRHLRHVNYISTREMYTLSEIDDQQGANIFLAKSKEWSYEHEIRMLHSLNEADTVINEKIYLFNLPPLAIKNIYLGCRMLDEKRNKIIDILNNNHVYKHIALFQAEIDQEYYRLNFKEIVR